VTQVSSSPASRPSSGPSSGRARLLGLACLPLFPFAIAILVHVPLAGPEIVRLDGEWMAYDARPKGALNDVTLEDVRDTPEAERSIRVPGPLPRDFTRPTLIRAFSIERAPNEPYMLVVGGFSNLVADVFVNGAWVGSEGVPATGYKLHHVGLLAFPIASERLRIGENDVMLRFVAEGHAVPMAGTFGNLVERRLLIGPQSAVRPWFDRVYSLERLLDLGGIVLLLFLAGLTLVLSLVESDPRARVMQRVAAVLSLAIVGYLAGKSGIAITFGLSRDIVPKSITFIAFAILELVERAMLGRVTNVQRTNRVVCVLHLLSQMFTGLTFVYLIFVPYLFVIVLYGTTIAMRGAWRLRSVESTLLAGSFLALALAAVNDLLTDLNILATPRLFTLAAVDVGVIASVFVVSRFIGAMRENVSLLADVEQKNQELTVAIARAEESTRLKSAFLANTSHELRTPLNSIINVPEGLLEEFVQRPFVVCGACQSVFETPEGYELRDDEDCPECGARVLSSTHRAVFVGDPEATMKYLHAIQQSGRHLLAVVNDILDFSKIEAGRMEIHVEDTSFDELLERLELAMLPLAEARHIRLDIPRPGANARMRTDSTRVTQVLMNLVSNAIKFSPDGSVVTIRTAFSDDHVALRVTDEGIGIAAGDLGRIFESFLQLDNSHTRKVGGTGLGLAITKRIVDLLDGDIDVESVLGRGTTFTVRLPRAGPSVSALHT
jgi:signal transduction histidine kinase